MGLIEFDGIMTLIEIMKFQYFMDFYVFLG